MVGPDRFVSDCSFIKLEKEKGLNHLQFLLRNRLLSFFQALEEEEEKEIFWLDPIDEIESELLRAAHYFLFIQRTLSKQIRVIW